MQTNNRLREALEATNKFLESAIIDGRVTAQDITALRNIVSAARSEPVRNCEVGTADEQFKRHSKWCARTRDFSCAATMCRKCFASWSQMPYEEGGAK